MKSTKLLLQLSTILAKTHCSKLTNTCYYHSFRRFNLSPVPTAKYFSSEKKTSDEVKDEFDLFEEDETRSLDIDYAALVGDNPELLKKLKLCELEVSFLQGQQERVPKKIQTEHWHELLKMDSKKHRLEYLNFLWLKEIKKKNDKLKKEKKRSQFLEHHKDKVKIPPSEITTSSPIQYGLTQTSLFHRFQERHMNEFLNYKLLQAMVFGPQIIVDCGFEQYMTTKELNLLGKQVLFMWSDNRHCYNPFDIIHCNLTDDSRVLKKMIKVIPSIIEDPAYPFNYTSKNYLDLYPKEKLVYLTPHCSETLQKFDGNDIYIIGKFVSSIPNYSIISFHYLFYSLLSGAIVDKSYSEPLTLAKAKRDGIRVARFPLENYLNWGMGGKSLTLNQVGIFNIHVIIYYSFFSKILVCFYLVYMHFE